MAKDRAEAKKSFWGAAYRDRQMAVLLVMGFSSGLPYLLTQDLARGWITRSGIDLKTLGGFVSLAALPYALKFLWAPLMDRYRIGPANWGKRRGWVLLMQSLLVISLLGMAVTGPASAQSAIEPFLILTVLTAWLSSLQDIAVDAYRTDVLEGPKLGSGVAVFVTGYRLALIAAGAGTMMLAGWLIQHGHDGWRWGFGLMAVLMALTLAITLLASPPLSPPLVPPPLSPSPSSRPPCSWPPMTPMAPDTLWQAIGLPIRQFANQYRWSLLTMLAFVALFKLPEEMAKAMMMPLLLNHLKFSEQEVGAIKQVVGPAMLIVGTLLGGGVTAKWGVMRSLWLFGVLHALSNLSFFLLTQVTHHWGMLAIVIAIESFCMGLAQAGFLAYLTGCCDRRYAAFQYALLTSVMALSVSLGGYLSATLTARFGYEMFFALSVIAGAPAMLLLLILSRRRRRALPGI